MAYPANTERNREVIEKRESDPTKWTITKLASHYGLTKQRVWQILQEKKTGKDLSTA